MKIIKVKDNHYRRRIKVITDCTYKEYYKKLKDLHGIDSDESYSSGSFDKILDDDKIYYYIWFKEFEGYVSEYGILFHEINHLTFEALRDIGITVCEESEEAFTYYAEYLTIEILRSLAKNNESKKKKKSCKAKNNSKSKAKKTAKN